MKERTFAETKEGMNKEQRLRREIVDNLFITTGTDENTRRLILEVLLDIRDLLKNK